MAGLEPAVSSIRTRRALQATPHRVTVGIAGFEPALSCTPSRRINQVFPDPEQEHPAGVEPAQRTWQGRTLPLHHGCLAVRRPAAGVRPAAGRIGFVAALSKSEPNSGTRGTRTLPSAGPIAGGRAWSFALANGAGGSRTPTPSVKSRVRCRLRHGPASPGPGSAPRPPLPY